jgi:RHS repeat-associated protein
VEYDNTLSSFGDAIPILSKEYFREGFIGESGASAPFAHHYYLSDSQGTVHSVVSNGSSPTLEAQYSFDPWGKRSSPSVNHVESDVGYAGYFHHNSVGGALELSATRAYAPTLGRWLTRDPLGTGVAFMNGSRFNGTDLNLYAFVRNDPASLQDPSGLYFVTDDPEIDASLARLSSDPNIGYAIQSLADSPDAIEIQQMSVLGLGGHGGYSHAQELMQDGFSYGTDFDVAIDVESANMIGVSHMNLPTNIDQLLAHELGHVWAYENYRALNYMSPRAAARNERFACDFENSQRGPGRYHTP